ncbi:UspA domain-containing protein [Natrialba hulunbeirensis JCM 10989]|uniref:UspA domain-containing protein n=1 Tax=Natrialba hulunbeirensis JCM 10989 TaxID=1227493 RepID=L9ZR00_9EURY|nr:universal stress protein [Natrialba hulunbeirensis]ELY87558.1 UspA domain-containing protein [Natrialba hulunbeirensis JCM 10989]
MYQDVLIPTDGSDGTRRSIAHGLTIAEQFDARVHALSVVPEGPLGTLESEEATPTAHHAVDHVAAKAAHAGIEATTSVENGVPHEVILEYADEHGIDMIVMGTQGRTGLDRVLVGSVTERVVRMAEMPIVTVRATDDLQLETAEEAEALAREHATEAGYDVNELAAEPRRTSATWYYQFETTETDDPVRLSVDAVSGDVRPVPEPAP